MGTGQKIGSDEGIYCPLKAQPDRLGTGFCTKGKCAWWLGEGCAIAYVGANCKANLRPWREVGNESRES